MWHEISCSYGLHPVGTSNFPTVPKSWIKSKFQLKPSPIKMCVVEVPFKLYFAVNVCSKFITSIKEPVYGKKNFIIGIPENLLHLLIPFVQNLTFTFSILSEFSAKTCFVSMTLSCQIWKPLHLLTSKFCF